MFLSHLVMVPSVMDSPIWGMRTSTPGVDSAGGADGAAGTAASGCGGAIAASLAAVASAAGSAESALRSAGCVAEAAAGAEAAPGFCDGADDGVDLDGGAFLDQDLAHNAGGGGGDFGIDLVGGDFEEGLVAFDGFAGLLEPLGEGAFGDGLAHLGHDYFGRHGYPWLL